MLESISKEDIEKLKVLMSLLNIQTMGNTVKEIVTLRVFVEEYKTHIKNTRSENYLRSINISLNHLTNFFGKQKSINSINQKDVETFLIFLQQRVKSGKHKSNSNGKGYLVYYRNLKAAFNKALEWNYVTENYFAKIKIPRRQKIQPVFITESDLKKICEKIENNVVRDFVILAFYTGMRLNEIINLTWKNINLNSRVITVGDEEFETKGKKQRFIPISQEALISILSQRERKKAIPIGNSFVFTKTNGEKYTGDYFSRRFKRACVAVGMDKAVHFHTLRHSFASYLVQKGVPLFTIKELLGHSSISTTEIYSHLNVDVLKEAIKVFDETSPPAPPLIKERGESLRILNDKQSENL